MLSHKYVLQSRESYYLYDNRHMYEQILACKILKLSIMRGISSNSQNVWQSRKKLPPSKYVLRVVISKKNSKINKYF